MDKTKAKEAINRMIHNVYDSDETEADKMAEVQLRVFNIIDHLLDDTLEEKQKRHDAELKKEVISNLRFLKEDIREIEKLVYDERWTLAYSRTKEVSDGVMGTASLLSALLATISIQSMEDKR